MLTKEPQDHWKLFETLDADMFEQQLRDEAETIIELLVAKRKSYGSKNFTEFGDLGVLIRMNDKFKRLIHMQQSNLSTTEVGESVEDAYSDIIGYSLLVLLAHKLV